MFRYTDDPIADHEAYMVELARLEKLVPVCMHGEHPVMEDHYYGFSDEQVICAEHLDEYHKKIHADLFDLACDYCHEYIDDDHYYENDDGEVFHKACVDKHFRKEVIVE